MKLTISFEEKIAEIDGGLDEQEMELAPFNFCIEELNQYMKGKIVILFDKEKQITLDFFYDFAVCYDEILDSIISAKNKILGKDQIWFCEQGSDFYINYEIKDHLIDIEFKKGASTGNPNKNIKDFKATVDRTAYIDEWASIFSIIILKFKEKLNKDIEIPF